MERRSNTFVLCNNNNNKLVSLPHRNIYDFDVAEFIINIAKERLRRNHMPFGFNAANVVQNINTHTHTFITKLCDTKQEFSIKKCFAFVVCKCMHKLDA